MSLKTENSRRVAKSWLKLNIGYIQVMILTLFITSYTVIIVYVIRDVAIGGVGGGCNTLIFAQSWSKWN
jgi:hypothetical protein